MKRPNIFYARKESEKESLVKQRPASEDGPPSAVDVDIAPATRTACIVAVSTGAILSLLCLISGIYIVQTNRKTLVAGPWSISSAGQEVLALAVNTILTLCIDGMMLVHSVSLRWALYRDGRLQYNTNIRLFTSSKSATPNKGYINVLALFCLVLCYGASSILLLDNQALPEVNEYTPISDAASQLAQAGTTTRVVNGTALVALGLGLAGQAAIAVWCLALAGCELIPTWSSNPLNTTLAAMQIGTLAHQPGRCMLSVHQRHQPPHQAVYPAERQGNMVQAQRVVRYILALLWTLTVLAIAWPITIAAVSMSIGNSSAPGQAVTEPLPCWRFGFNWNEDSSACSRNYVTLSLSPSANTHNPDANTFSYSAEAVLCLVFVCAIQAGQTIALHCAELLVNLSRDEKTWRQAYSNTNQNQAAPGAQLSTNPFISALSSWENTVLFTSKAVLHWIIGRSMLPSIGPEDNGQDLSLPDYTSINGFQFDMVYSRLIIYAILAFLLAVFATYLALKRPRGCQPAAFGHLQTLADLIDDWGTDHDGRLWWGDKTVGDDYGRGRHAGTSWDRTVLSPICAGDKYSGNRYLES
ncbi:hypothetical protein PISL3812_00249 [Talaromyces islandicus]|uniref:Uncharacterized protein n=1 Tax=Talaromyces islandicus TaxID=28573 RepID=A0A0U1LJE2_TALIS|nr:hypothetical protein PISL3812_00249 [Talaromyces islandicus]